MRKRSQIRNPHHDGVASVSSHQNSDYLICIRHIDRARAWQLGKHSGAAASTGEEWCSYLSVTTRSKFRASMIGDIMSGLLHRHADP